MRASRSIPRVPRILCALNQAVLDINYSVAGALSGITDHAHPILHYLKNQKFYLMLILDAAIFSMAYVLAHLLRFEFTLGEASIQQIKWVLPYLIFMKLLVFCAFGLYKGMWRFSGIEDLRSLAGACFVSITLALWIPLYFAGLSSFSRAVILLDGVLTFVMAGGLRMAIRCYYTARNTASEPHGLSLISIRTRNKKNRKRILIIGAGRSGEKILREVFDNPELDYQVVGFLDDDPRKMRRTIHGVPVLGDVERLPEAVRKYSPEQVFISIPSASGAQMLRIVEICKSCNVAHKALPAIAHIIDGRISIKALRDVNYEDLLRREPVRLDTSEIAGYLSGRTVMVTGAGGSIGSELVRQVVRFNPARLVLVDAGEANLYAIQMELQHELKFPDYHCILTRVQDRSRMEAIFQAYRPEVIFHAAAYKHVPMLEKNPWEAVFTNVLGSRVVMELALKYEAGRFVLVSTDKAVRPTNVMGTTKRVTEMIMLGLQGNSTKFMAVRFGNVVGSSGSVIPLFRKQIVQGGPVTVTHPEMTRYFMTIPEAAQLILQAGALGQGGEIFVLEMGTPVKIADMARDLIRLSGKEPGKDIEIVFTGLRDGEKLYEELITHGEDILTTGHEKIMVLRAGDFWNGKETGDKYRAWLDIRLEALYGVANAHDAGGIKRELNRIVPEYTPQENDSVLARLDRNPSDIGPLQVFPVAALSYDN